MPSHPESFYVGVDVGRNRDLTVMTVLEKQQQTLIVRAILRLQDMRLPDQQQRLAAICPSAPVPRRAYRYDWPTTIKMTH